MDRQKRLLVFFIAWTALFLLFNTFLPKPIPPAEEGNADVGEVETVAETPVTPSLNAADSADGTEIERPDRPELISLGSMDPDDGYSLLVTLNSRGAGVERVEVTGTDEDGELAYRRVDVRHGYLGYLGTRDGLDPPSGGIRGANVRVVGRGTPADRAGIRVGDVIRQIDGVAVEDEDSVDAALLETRPGDVVEINLDRGGSPRTVRATLTHHPLDLIRLATTAGVDQVPGNLTRLSCLMTLSAAGNTTLEAKSDTVDGWPDAAATIWRPDFSADDVIGTASFEMPIAGTDVGLGGGTVTLRRSYTLPKNSYVVDLDLGVENGTDTPTDLGYRLEGPNGLTLEGWWYSNKIARGLLGGAAARDVVYQLAGESDRLLSGYDLIERATDEPEDPVETIFAAADADAAPDLKYVGVDAQYFTAAYLPGGDATTLADFRRFTARLRSDVEAMGKHRSRAVNSTFALDSEIQRVPPGGTLTDRVRLFTGPKDPDVLAPLGLSGVVYYGWFEYFSKLLAGVLHFFSGIGNYAIAIILLTVCVRGLMFPLSRKAAVNAQKMQELAPEMKKIAEKYKDDMEGRLRAQQALQKKAGFNPLAGCAPMFLQLPIFVGLYRALSVDIELRQQPLIPGIDWASNLAGPDMFAYWGDWMPDYFGGRGTGWLGPYFNLLPILVVVLFLTQQKLFMPPATDEQTRLTQKMMNFMTLLMGLFFFRVPAGLCVYFITSSLWGIGERIFVKKTLPKGKHFENLNLDAAVTAEADGSATVTSASLAQRLRDRVQPPEPEVVRPNKRKRPKRK